MIDPQLLEMLACPLCPTRPGLKQRDHLLVCKDCGHGYRVVDDIPRMLPEDALTPEEVDKELHG